MGNSVIKLNFLNEIEVIDKYKLQIEKTMGED